VRQFPASVRLGALILSGGHSARMGEDKALHPLGTAPIITDGDVVPPESAAIIDYIIGKYGQGRLTVGPEAANYADYLFWFHYANGGFMPAQMSVMIARMLT